ncbi:MAG: hypothetical protein JWO31_4144, partial [Phycisphaerales bacterium]|nr:hypothetical protein [Phycisphaerales bacterium]
MPVVTAARRPAPRPGRGRPSAFLAASLA